MVEAIKGTCVGSRDGVDSFDLPVALMAGTLNSKVFKNTLYYALSFSSKEEYHIGKGPCRGYTLKICLSDSREVKLSLLGNLEIKKGFFKKRK
jgi:hypothetical protein